MKPAVRRRLARAERAERAAAQPARPAPPRQRRSAFGRVFYSLFILGAAGLLVALSAAIYGYHVYTSPGPLAQAKVFEIRRGLKLPEIAADLEKAGIIASKNLFVSAAYFTGSRGRLKAGEYQFAKSMSMRDVLGLVVQGESIVYKLTIPEGWTTAQALERVKANPLLAGNITIAPAEGSLLPDTYIFRKGDSRDDVLHNMMDSSTKLLDELWQKRAPDLMVKTKEEALTLASIVEKETAVPEERRRIASVFHNRLRQGMRLQSDPTIIYGITLGKSNLDRPLTRKDIAETTPYNTYRIDGLPPGPIANPGRDAIAATLTPGITQDLYFVADGSGGHAFAKTLEEHRANVAKWREIEKKRNQAEQLVMEDEAPPEPAPAQPQPAPQQPAEVTSDLKPQIVSPPLPPIEPGQTATETKPAEPAKPAEAAKPAEPEKPATEPAKPAGIAKPAEPEKPTGIAKPAEAAAAVVEDAPLPPARKPEPAVLQKQAAVAGAGKPAKQRPAAALRPGQIVSVANRRVPIPVPKPRFPTP